MDWGTASSILAIIVSVITLGIAIFKAPLEQSAGLVEASGDITETAMALLEPMRERVRELETSNRSMALQISEMTNKFTVMEKEMAGLRNTVDLYRDWANRLVYQVRSMGAEPVPLEKKEK